MYRAFLSARPEKEMKIFEYMRRGFKTGKDLYSYWKEPWAREILEMGREVGNEAEKFRGILRFSELEEGMLLLPSTRRTMWHLSWRSTSKPPFG